MTPLRIAVLGCCGRMGRAILRVASAEKDLRIVAAVTVATDDALGRDAGAVAAIERLDVPIGVALDAPCDVAIEFTSTAGTRQWAAHCAERGVPLVSGTTGLSDADSAVLDAAATRIPILWSANMSVGVMVLAEAVRRAAEILGAGWDAEVVETHHRRKADAPSGTAKLLVGEIADGRGRNAPSRVIFGRAGACGARPDDEIGVHAVRQGGVVGDHDVRFASEMEVLTFSHRALSRDVFAAGALRAARWIHGRAPGRYTLRDVLAR